MTIHTSCVWATSYILKKLWKDEVNAESLISYS